MNGFDSSCPTLLRQFNHNKLLLLKIMDLVHLSYNLKSVQIHVQSLTKDTNSVNLYVYAYMDIYMDI